MRNGHPRAMTLLEVVLSSVLTLALVTVIVKWSGVLQIVASSATARNDSQRAGALISTRLGSDVEQATGCDVLRRDHPVEEISNSRVVLLSDVTGDGVAERVTWSIQGSVLKRVVEAGLGSCTYGTVTYSANVVDNIDASSPSSFTVLTGGSDVELTTPLYCAQDPTQCQFQAIRLRLTILGGDSSTIDYIDSYVVNQTASFVGGLDSAASSTLSVPAAPDAPAVQAAQGAVLVSAVAPSIDGGAPVTYYEFNVTDASGSPATGVTGATTRSSSAPSLVFTGLTPATSYIFSVRAINAAGASAYSPSSLAVTPLAASSALSQYAFSLGSTGTDVATALHVSADGETTMAGTFEGSLNIGSTELQSAGLTDVFVARFSSSGVPVWAQSFGSTGADTVEDIDIASGNVYLAGSYTGTLVSYKSNVGSVTSSGLTDGFIAVLSSQGTPLYLRSVGGAGADALRAVSATSSGDIYTAGEFSGTVSYAGSSLVSAGGTDVLVARLSATATPTWALRSGGPGNDRTNAIELLDDESWAIAGDFVATMRVGATTLTSFGSTDAFYATGTQSGTFVAAQGFGGSAADSATSLDSSATQMFIGGSFEESANLGDAIRVSSGSSDVFVVAVARSSFVVEWSASGGGAGIDTLYGLVSGPDGYPVLGGSFSGAATFGSTGLTSVGGLDAFLARATSSGTFSGASRAGGASDDAVRALTSTTMSIYVAGFFSGTAAVGAPTLASKGSTDGFLAWATQFLVW